MHSQGPRETDGSLPPRQVCGGREGGGGWGRVVEVRLLTPFQGPPGAASLRLPTYFFFFLHGHAIFFLPLQSTKFQSHDHFHIKYPPQNVRESQSLVFKLLEHFSRPVSAHASNPSKCTVSHKVKCKKMKGSKFRPNEN